MGIRRSLLYQAVICLPLLAVWQYTTGSSSEAFAPLPLLAAPSDAPMPFALSLSIQLFVLFDAPNEVSTSALEEDLQRFVAQLTHFADVEMKIQTAFIDKVCCESCTGKMDAFSPYLSPVNLSRRSTQIPIFAIVTNKECEWIPGDNVVYVRKGAVGVLATYVVEVVRKRLGLRVDPGMELTNGFTAEELRSFPASLPVRLQVWLSHRVELFNSLMATNTPVVSEQSHQRIEYIRTLLVPANTYASLLEAARLLEQLLQTPDLYREEYFQADFKIGVYAPLFVPPIFPLVSVAYSLWTRRKRR